MNNYFRSQRSSRRLLVQVQFPPSSSSFHFNILNSLKHQLYTWDALNGKDGLSVLFAHSRSHPSLFLLSFSFPALGMCAWLLLVSWALHSHTYTHLNEAGLWSGITGTWQRGPNKLHTGSLPYRVHRTKTCWPERSHTPRTPINKCQLLKHYISHKTKIWRQYECCLPVQNSRSCGSGVVDVIVFQVFQMFSCIAMCCLGIC